jgi:DNA polymerase III alpha subunit
VYLSGVVIEVEERLVGDTKSIAEFPDKAKQKALGWGKPWARMTIEDVEGGRSWVKIDWTLVPIFREVIDQGVGSLVMVCARTRPDWQNFDAHYLASVEQAAEKLKRDPGELSIWERLFIEQYHPATTYRWESKSDRRLALLDMNERAAKATGSVSVIGVVSHLFTRPDKRGREMAFFGVAGLRSYLNVMCFSSAWEQLGPHLKPGVFARFKLTLLDGGSFHLEAKHDAIRLLQRGFTYAGNKSNM